MKNVLFIVRGLPGSGKSTLAKQIAKQVFEADQYFYNEKGEYEFDYRHIKAAHIDCFQRFSKAVDKGASPIAVANTSTTYSEFENYEAYAKANGYAVFYIIVENRNDTKSIHGVPADVMAKMELRFEIEL